jgi:hydrogenase-4 component E
MGHVMVLLSVLVVGCRRIDNSIAVFALQSVVFGIWLISQGGESVLAGILTLLIKGIAIPSLLLITLRRVEFKVQHGMLTTMKASMATALGLVLFSYWIVKSPGNGSVLPDILAPSLALIFLGIFIIISRSKTISQAIGIVLIENGISLASVSLTAGLPLIVEAGIFTDVAAGAVVMALLTTRIGRVYGSLNTKELMDLRG